MDQREEQITVEKCPMCTHAHVYDLDIDSSMIMRLMSAGESPKPVTKSFTRLFACAEGKGTFQMRITIAQGPNEIVNDVRVRADGKKAS
jgi:hypothetical protein